MPEEWDGEERRKHPRVALKGEVQGRIHTVASAPVVDLSLSGALLELDCTLRIGAKYSLRLTVNGSQILQLKGKITRSYVHGFDRNEKGETVIKYRSAVEFLELEDSLETALREIVHRVQDTGLLAELQSDQPVDWEQK
jgi:hypothetical protein